MSVKRNHLRLVSFDANDFSLGKTLHAQADQEITAPDEIGNVFSLYFQWPERARAVLRVNSQQGVEVRLECDQDELNPTELWLKGVPDQIQLNVGDSAEIIVEVLDRSFLFSCGLIGKTSDTHFLAIPPKMIALKPRAHKRFRVARQNAQVLLADGTGREVEIVEFNAGTLILSTNESIDPGADVISVLIGEVEFPVDLIDSKQGQLVVRTNLRSFDEIKAYFLIYLRNVAPSLALRNENLDEAISAYEKSGFFAKFALPGIDVNQLKKEIKEHWAKTEYKQTIDLVSKGPDGKVYGCSSFSLAFQKGGVPFWAMHSMCAIRDQSTFQNTKDLYVWRADLMSMLPSSDRVVCWFDAKSRWIERIWITFARNVGQMEEIVKPIKMKVIKGETHEQSETNARKFVESSDFLAGFGPRYLSISEVLDHILIFESQDINLQSLMKCREKVIGAGGPGDVRVTLPHNDYDAAIEALPNHNLNRYCEFPVTLAAAFRASLEYSFAVIQRKNEASIGRGAV